MDTCLDASDAAVASTDILKEKEIHVRPLLLIKQSYFYSFISTSCSHSKAHHFIYSQLLNMYVCVCMSIDCICSLKYCLKGLVLTFERKREREIK